MTYFTREETVSWRPQADDAGAPLQDAVPTRVASVPTVLVPQTLFAQRGSDLAHAFSVEVTPTTLEGPVRYRVELLPPEGASTGGGQRSVQHLRLAPLSGSGPVVVCGAWDPVLRVATLRSWELLAQQYAARFKGQQLPLDPHAWARSLQQLETFFLERSGNVEREDVEPAVETLPPAAPPAPEAKAAAKPAVERKRAPGWWAVGVALLLGVGAGIVAGGAMMYFVLR